jgi:hypothetical protein
MAHKLSCMRADDVQKPARDRAEGSCSRQTAALNTPRGSCSRHTAALHTTAGSRSRSTAQLIDEDSSDDEQGDPTFG